MFLKRLFVQNFRNYSEATAEFSPRINVIWGGNAQGKTSLLEAIHLLLLGRSFRTSKTEDLIQRDASSFCVEAQFVRTGIEQKLRIASNGKERRILYNSTECTSTSALLGLLPGVLMAPDDDLIKGPPASRRSFVDLQIAQIDPLYLHHFTRYTRAMRQRNHLLRNAAQTSIELWEQEMAVAASYLVKQRVQILRELELQAQPLYRLWSEERQPLTLRYHTKITDPLDSPRTQQEYLELWSLNRGREIALGNTLYGPHRDEIKICIGSHEAKTFGSEGQKRLCVAALRLAAWERLKSAIGEMPLMLLDDVGMSLDENRNNRLLLHLESLGQVFITSTRNLDTSSFSCEMKQFYIVNGGIKG